MPPELVTALVAELDARYGAAVADRAQNVVLRAGAVEVDVLVTGGGHRLIRAEFHSVGDSAKAAVELARILASVAGGGRSGVPVPGLRMGLCTGPHGSRDGGPRSGASPRSRAAALVERAGPGQILATEATAIVSGGGLPPGVDLVDRGRRRLRPGRAPERVYELHIAGLDGGDGPDRPGGDRQGDGGVALSNLEWARRAVGEADDSAPDLGDTLRALAAAWRTAQAGERYTVVLSGRRGACKTRAAAELALRLHAEGALVLYGRWDRDVAVPDQGIREAFGVYADRCGVEQLRADLEGWGDEIARLLPDVGARVGGPGAGGAGPLPVSGGERARLLDAVAAWIAVLARRRPTLLVFDDVQWAEPSSLLLIDHLHHASAGIPLLIVITFGADEVAGDGASPAPDPPAAPEVLAHAEADEVDRIDLDCAG